MAANMAAKRISLIFPVIWMLSLKTNYQNLCFGVREFVETKLNNERITILKMAANMAVNFTVKTDFINISGYNNVIIKNKVSKPTFMWSRNLEKQNST